MKNLIYGSIKPDIPLHFKGLKHFKPQSYEYITDEIYRLGKLSLCNNTEQIKLLSKQIGIVTHYIADYFCVPHNDRATYKNNFLNHLAYESNLHKLYKTYNNKIDVPKSYFNIENTTSHPIKSLVDTLHGTYSLKNESLKNDLESSIEAVVIVGLYIVYHNIINCTYDIAA